MCVHAQPVGIDQMRERFLRYVAINSQSIPSVDPDAFPISEGEKQMAELLRTEIAAMGVECFVSPDYYVYVRIPSNQKSPVPVLGFSVHTDYTPEANAVGIKPRVIEDLMEKRSG